MTNSKKTKLELSNEQDISKQIKNDICLSSDKKNTQDIDNLSLTISNAQSVNNEFSLFGFSESILDCLEKKGYKNPTPIQKEAIPELMLGRDLLGQAQTGTGKTAAFALPIIERINKNDQALSVLVLTPTRELATQVSEAFKGYCGNNSYIKTLAIYGGTDFRNQIYSIKKKPNVVVGTPGRIMDHMRQGTLNISTINCFVLDEADEMLKMGFIDDIEWISDKLPKEKQMILFSATMPSEIRKIAKKYLNNPAEIIIKKDKEDTELITQQYITVQRNYKIEALKRILELKNEGVIIFVRTKALTNIIADSLENSGHSVAVLNGDIPQNQRETTVERLKKGFINILVATDVAARGLDVDRIKLVVNYDFPFDKEAYIHRIGRTGRAGRKGEAILFVNNREKNLLRNLERSIAKRIEKIQIPDNSIINSKRIDNLTKDLFESYKNKSESRSIKLIENILETLRNDYSLTENQVAIAAINLSMGKKSLLLEDDEEWIKYQNNQEERYSRNRPFNKSNRNPNNDRGRNRRMQTYRIEYGNSHRVKVNHILSSVVSSTGLNRRQIGKIKIFEDYTLVDLPRDISDNVKNSIHRIKVTI
tara:strand:+ start:2451 stop:4229 length:1779 start_codon:yes stop_codon:yes gene_type:complete